MVCGRVYESAPESGAVPGERRCARSTQIRPSASRLSANHGRGRRAGPLTTRPLASNRAPWQEQEKPSGVSRTVQPRCVQRGEGAEALLVADDEELALAQQVTVRTLKSAGVPRAKRSGAEATTSGSAKRMAAAALPATLAQSAASPARVRSAPRLDDLRGALLRLRVGGGRLGRRGRLRRGLWGCALLLPSHRVPDSTARPSPQHRAKGLPSFAPTARPFSMGRTGTGGPGRGVVWISRPPPFGVPMRFSPIHHAAIANLERIAEFQPMVSGDFQGLLQGGTRLRMSRTYRRRIRDRFGQSL